MKMRRFSRRILYNQGQMSERDYQAYHDLYEGIRAFLPPPDLLVYLKGSVDTLLSRIRAARARL